MRRFCVSLVPVAWGLLVMGASRVFIGVFVSLSFILLPLRAEISLGTDSTASVGEVERDSNHSRTLNEFGGWVNELARVDGEDLSLGSDQGDRSAVSR